MGYITINTKALNFSTKALDDLKELLVDEKIINVAVRNVEKSFGQFITFTTVKREESPIVAMEIVRERGKEEPHD